jgi:hypothetical protein
VLSVMFVGKLGTIFMINFRILNMIIAAINFRIINANSSKAIWYSSHR